MSSCRIFSYSNSLDEFFTSLVVHTEHRQTHTIHAASQKAFDKGKYSQKNAYLKWEIKRQGKQGMALFVQIEAIPLLVDAFMWRYIFVQVQKKFYLKGWNHEII